MKVFIKLTSRKNYRLQDQDQFLSIALWRNSEYFKHGVLCADFSLFFYF